MAKRKKPEDVVKEELLLDPTPSESISQNLSQAAIQAKIHCFSNLDKHEGIEEMHMSAQDLASPTFLKELGNDMLVYADLPTSLRLQDYFNHHKIFTYTIYQWMDQDVYFKNCYLLAKEKIGSRREQLGLFRETDSNQTFKSMPIYSHEYKWLEEWRSELAAKAKVVPEPTKVTFVLDRRSNELGISSGQDNGSDLRSSVGSTQVDGDARVEAEGPGQPEKASE